MMISKVRGRFENFSGNINFDENNPTSSTVKVEIDAASINTRVDDRDNHLRSADFLDVENHPTLTFVSKRIEVTGDNSGKLIGDLTIRDVANEVVLDVEYAGQAKSPWGMTSAGFSASTKINRKDWGLEWNAPLETGGFLVGDTITIDIELELVKQPETEKEAAGD
jgi:polyisoprenoid-binding protein YceI